MNRKLYLISAIAILALMTLIGGVVASNANAQSKPASSGGALTNAPASTGIAGITTQAGKPSSPLTQLGSGFTYQGRLLQSNNPVNGQYDFAFRLYDAVSGGNLVGSPSVITLTNQTASDGLYTVVLDFGASAMQGDARWLELAVQPTSGGGFTTLLPRQQLTAAPYASSLMPGAVISGASASNMLTVNNSNYDGISGTSISHSGVYGASTSGAGGWFSSTSNSGVNGFSATASGVRGQSTGFEGVSGVSTSGTGVRGNSTNSFGGYFTSGSTDGVYGLGSANNAAGVTGRNDIATGYGVYGISNGGQGVHGESANIGVYGTSTGNDGVQGHSSAVNGAGVAGVNDVSGGFGLYGQSANGHAVHGISTSGYGIYGFSTNNVGVQGESTSGAGVRGVGAGNQPGVIGSNTGPAGNGGSGVYAFSANGSAAVYAQMNGGNNGVYAITGGTGAAVYGDNTNGSGYAGYFNGRVRAVGGCCTSPELFTQIDDPQQPADKYLYHSSVQSPDMKDIYDGNVTTDAKGEATIIMPSYFEALNRDFRYQLTVIDGQFAQAVVSSKIKDGLFTIKTEKPNVEVSWQVTGIRHDPYAEKYRVPVVQDKPTSEKGYYMYPELYGQPKTKSVDKNMREPQAAPNLPNQNAPAPGGK